MYLQIRIILITLQTVKLWAKVVWATSERQAECKKKLLARNQSFQAQFFFQNFQFQLNLICSYAFYRAQIFVTLFPKISRFE